MINLNANSLLRNKSYSSLFKNENIISKLKSHMTFQEINKSPAISLALNPNKKITFNLLTHKKYKIIPQSTKTEKKQRLINAINSFRKIYFNYNKNIRYSLDELNNMSKSNKLFIKQYNNMIEKSNISNKNLFPDIKAEYEKQNYILPDIGGSNNLFNGSLLLSNNDEDLKKYIKYEFSTQKSNQKSISFLEKMNEGIDDISKEEPQDLFNKVLTPQNNVGNFSSPLALKAYRNKPKKLKKEIISIKRDVKRIKRTIDSLPDLEYFLNSDNKEYLDTLRYFNSRNTSANFSTGLVEGTIGNNFSSMDRYNKSNIFSIKNISKYTYDDKDSNQSRSKIKYNLSPNTINSFGNSGIQNNFSTHLIINKLKKKKKKKPKIIVLKNYKKTLENLYNKISTSYDSTPFDKNIKRYLKFRRYNIEPKISQENICKNMENLREKICKDKSIKRVIEFRKNVGEIFDEVDNLNENQNQVEKKVNDIEDQMIKAFSSLRN